MPISNITRTNTIDEWRIQTNLSANALNRIETGNYDKTAGSLNIACTAVLSITSTGTGLSVANNALVSGEITVGRGIALGSEGAATGNLTVGANTFIYGRGAALFVANSAIVNVSLQATQSIRTNNIIANTDASISGTAQIGFLTVNNSTSIGTTLAVTSNTTVGNLVTANSVVGDNGRFTSNLVASHFVTTAGSLVADSARITSNATFGESTATTINATNARISGNANVSHLSASGSTVTDSLRITSDAGIGGTLRVTGNSVFGNVNTANMIYSGSLRTVGRADIGSALTVTGDASVGGKLSVTGDFILEGNIIYDTEVLTISTVSPITTTGAGLFGVFRGNTTGGINGHNGLANSDANAYIRWSASSNTWQIRDVFNADSITSYSKILTANLINSSLTSTSTDTFLSSLGAKSLKDTIDTESSNRQANVGALRIDTTNANNSLAANIGAARIADAGAAQANSGSGDITVTNAYRANVGAARLELLANTGAGIIAANTNLKNYTDTTFLKLSATGTTQTVTSDLALNGNLTVTGTTTYLNTTELNVSDNEIVLNSDWPANTAPTQNAGITIHRGLHSNIFIRYDESNDYWVLRDNVAQFIIATTANVGSTLSQSQANIGASVISITNAYQANTGAARLELLANVGAARISDTAAAQANTGSGLISLNTSITNAYQANVGAGLISVTNAYQANVGSARISDTAAAQANTGSARIEALNAVVTANTNLKNYIDSTLGTTSDVQHNSLGIGTAASGVSGEIRATGDITAGYSDDRLKNKIGNIENAVEKVCMLNGFYYEANDIAQQLGYTSKRQVGVSAQEVQKVLPEIITTAPIDENYLTIHYEKLVPLLIEAIKELKAEIEELKKK